MAIAFGCTKLEATRKKILAERGTAINKFWSKLADGKMWHMASFLEYLCLLHGEYV